MHAAAIASSRRAYACMQQSPASSIGHSIGPADRDRLCCLQRSLAGCLCYCVLTLRDHTLPSGPSFEIEPEEIKRGSRQAMREKSHAARLVGRTDRGGHLKSEKTKPNRTEPNRLKCRSIRVLGFGFGPHLWFNSGYGLGFGS